MTTKIIMLDSRYGSEDGFGVKSFKKGEKYEIADSLAAEFIHKGHARATSIMEDMEDFKALCERVMTESTKH